MTTLAQDVTAFGALAEIWPGTRQRAADLTAKFRGLAALPKAPSQQANLDAAQNALVALWVKLTSIQNAAGLNAMLASGADFDAVETQLDQVDAAIGPLPPAPVISTLMAALVSAPPPIEEWFRSMADSRTTASDPRRVELLRERIARSDFAVTAFAFGIALITGLNAYYFGKPFGSIGDYATLFLWAAGTKAVLDIAVAITSGLGAGITPSSAQTA